MAGIDKLKALPASWYAFTNLDVVLGPGRAREIDVIIVADDRIFLVDLKDWRGKIESAGGRWVHRGRDHGPSPVLKINQIAREVGLLLKEDLRKHAKGARITAPWVLGMVVITGGADISGIAGAETASVFRVDDFIKHVSSDADRTKCFGPAPAAFASDPLTSATWKHRIGKFFNTQTGPVRAGSRRYGNFVAIGEATTFEHAGGMFNEYNVADEHAPQTLGTLRLWDFTRADTRFQSEEGRSEIAGRERSVVGFVQDRSDACAQALLAPRAEDPERGVSYWEIYDRRRRLKRLGEFAHAYGDETVETRVELARQLIAAIAAMHSIDAAHLDLGEHSVWLETPSTVRVSHLMAARFPEVRSLGEARYQFLSSARAPEDGASASQADPKRKDVYLLGVCVHHILFRVAPALAADDCREWDATIDEEERFANLHEWLERAFAKSPADRFEDAGTALNAFNKATEARPTRQEIIEGLEAYRTKVRSQRQFLAAYPEVLSIRESDRLDVWQSTRDGAPALVKMWKSAAWGDPLREGPRILDFLDRARDLRLSPPPGCARVREVFWLGDAIAVVQDLAPGDDLSVSLGTADRWRDVHSATRFLLNLTKIVEGLHARGLTHGDLKPQNIIVDALDLTQPALVDLLDFSPGGDGDIVSSAYAPALGGRQERDRFAVTRIAEEVFATADADVTGRGRLVSAIEQCRNEEPNNSTLLPLEEALRAFAVPPPTSKALRLELSVRSASTGPILPDEDKFFVRYGSNDQAFVVRGACAVSEQRCRSV